VCSNRADNTRRKHGNNSNHDLIFLPVTVMVNSGAFSTLSLRYSSLLFVVTRLPVAMCPAIEKPRLSSAGCSVADR